MHQEAYDKAEGLRRSDLWKIHQSPKHFKNSIDNPDNATASLTFGIAMHKYLLEPDTFFDEYAITPKVDRRKKEGKQVWENFVQHCEDNNVEPLDEESFKKIKTMTEVVNANPLAVEVLKGQHETEWYWTDPLTGEKLKVKCDNITTYNNKKYIVDYKTTDSCEDGHFERSAKRYGYQFQAGFYITGVSANTNEELGFIFVAQEKKPPYAVRVYIASEAFIETGKIQYRQYLDTYHDCKTTGNWYGYEGPATVPQPTLLMDDSERIYNQRGSLAGASLYENTFSSDEYSENEESDIE